MESIAVFFFIFLVMNTNFLGENLIRHFFEVEHLTHFHIATTCLSTANMGYNFLLILVGVWHNLIFCKINLTWQILAALGGLNAQSDEKTDCSKMDFTVIILWFISLSTLIYKLLVIAKRLLQKTIR